MIAAMALAITLAALGGYLIGRASVEMPVA